MKVVQGIDTDEIIILKWILEKWDGMRCGGLNESEEGFAATSCGFRVAKSVENFWVAEELFTCQ